MVKDFEYVVVAVHHSMECGVRVERVLPLNTKNEQDVINEMKVLIQEVISREVFEERLSSIEDVDVLIDVYESICAEYSLVEGYLFSIKKIG